MARKGANKDTTDLNQLRGHSTRIGGNLDEVADFDSEVEEFVDEPIEEAPMVDSRQDFVSDSVTLHTLSLPSGNNARSRDIEREQFQNCSYGSLFAGNRHVETSLRYSEPTDDVS